MNWMLQQGRFSTESSDTLCNPFSSVSIGLRPRSAAAATLLVRSSNTRYLGPGEVIQTCSRYVVSWVRGGLAGVPVPRVTAYMVRSCSLRIGQTCINTCNVTQIWLYIY